MPTVYADGDRLIQVVTNLLSNALKFTDGGFVEARAAKIQLRKPEEARLLGTHAPQLPPGEWLLVSVADTGIGIDEENFPKVFERFQQVGDTLTDRPRGTGLGLTICQEIVAYHKGFIWLESTVGVGSTFSFVLPLAVSAAEAVSTDHYVSVPSVAKTSVISHGGGPLILAVDDDASVRSLLLQELTDAGYTTVGAADGTEALQIVHTLSPALVILDVHMPGIDGLTVARTLKEDRQTAQIPVILLSVSEGVEKGILAGAEAFRTKPLDMPGLLSTVRSLLTDDAQSLQGSGDD
jgi:CheY-like chemotaxis protein